jgi:D-alanine-D-alanine ligase
MTGQGRISVAVVFGGRSTEHPVTCVPAASVLANPDPARFEVLPFGITPQGSWVLGPADPATPAIDGRTMRRRAGTGSSSRAPVTSEDPGAPFDMMGDHGHSENHPAEDIHTGRRH